jgi:hypothetical protein
MWPQVLRKWDFLLWPQPCPVYTLCRTGIREKYKHALSHRPLEKLKYVFVGHIFDSFIPRSIYRYD